MGLLPGRRLVFLILILAAAIAGAVVGAGLVERNAAVHASQRQDLGEQMLTAMLDQETGARGYFETRERQFLSPWYRGIQHYASALTHSFALVGDDRELHGLLVAQGAIASVWQQDIGNGISAIQAGGAPPTIADSVLREHLMDRFRATNATYQTVLVSRRNADFAWASWLSAILAAGIVALLAAAGYAVLRRSSRLDAKRRAKRAELRELLEASTSEAESRRLLIRHAQRVVPGAGAAMLTRNDTEKRLELTKADEAAPVLADLAIPESLEPRACLAVRLSRSYRQDAGTDPLIRCDACGAARGSTVCEPLLVAGTVIGTILVTREKRIDETEVAEVRNAVQLAAPILANQRNLALAEMRAATDTLTGLPNRRAAEEQLTRMVAHAGRSLGPLSALLLDLDHFKQVNDIHGHELGDQVLAIVAQTLRQSIRTSDFAARYGGEEFLILLPDTDTTGGQAVAEKLRTDIAAVDVPGLDRITASMGLAVVPDHALDVLQLLRQADRALYRAKEGGRNRVVVADRERASLPAA